MINQPYLIESSLILLLGFIIYKLFFAADKAFSRNRVYLLLLLLFSIVLPLISIPVFARKIFAVPINRTVNSSFKSQVEIVNSFDWMSLATLLYWSVVIVLSIRFLMRMISILRIIGLSNSVVIDNVKFIITSELDSPSSFFNNLIVEDLNIPKEIINHEKVHIGHRHTWDMLLMEIVKIVLWFNPVVYFMALSLKENHEYAADHIAAQNLENEFDYSDILIQFAKSNKSPILLNTFSSITKKRIIMLSKNKSNNVFKSLLVIPLFLAIFSLFSFDTFNVNVDPGAILIIDSIPESRLDTIITFDIETGTESIQIERVFPNDIRTWRDTTVIFDADTYEEQVQVVTSYAPRTEVLEQTYTTNQYNTRTGNLETHTYKRYPQEMMEVTDTVVTFNYDTYEEKFEIVKKMAPREELISTKVTPKSKIKKGQKFDNVTREKGKIITTKKGN